MQTFAAVVITLSALILFHEFGHFIIAKLFGVRVQRFSLGLGPRAIGVTKGETDYRISWVPFGGYVKLAGMEEGEIKGEPGEFQGKSTWAKGLIVLAGPVFNFILAAIIFYFTALLFGREILKTTVVGEIIPDSPAAHAGIQVKDRIITVDNFSVTHWEEIHQRLVEKKNEEISIEIERDGLVQMLSLIPAEEYGILPYINAEIGAVERGSPADLAGIQTGDVILSIDGKEIDDWEEMVDIVHGSPDSLLQFVWLRGEDVYSAEIRPKMRLLPAAEGVKPTGLIGVALSVDRMSVGPLKAIGSAFTETTRITYLILHFIWQLIRGEMPVSLLGGPVSIVRLTGQSARWGFENLLDFVGLLSINLAIFNLLFVPPLDGGYLVFISLEGIRRKPLSRNFKLVVQNVGIALLMIMVILVTFNDIMRIGK
jgi:regulator of sigma E protease